MADNEPPDEVSANSTEPLPWPDPSRPIISDQLGSPGYLPNEPYLRRDWLPSERRRRRAFTATLVILVLTTILVAVWLLWWR